MNSPLFQNIAIVGAGAMGCLFGARLAMAGATVSLVDVVSERITAIKKDGIRLSDDAGEHLAHVKAHEAAQLHGPLDLAIIFTKAAHTESAVRSIRHAVSPQTFALTLQNGLGNAESIATLFSPSRVFMGSTDLPSDLHGHNHVASHGSGSIWLGAMVKSDAGVFATQALVSLFNSAGLNAKFDPDVEVTIWEKAAFNAAINAVTTVGNVEVGQLDTGAGRWIISQIISEAAAVAAANGVNLNIERMAKKADFALKNHIHHVPSMLQDRRAGRKTEIEAINGALVRAGSARGISMPVTETMANLVRLIEAATI